MQKCMGDRLKSLGGYGRRLKKKKSAKGFTLVELIVVIVILAILAAILIPGLLKWIDQAKDKKYELEAREIAQAAEAALTKVYASGSVEMWMGYHGDLHYESDYYSSRDFMKMSAFSDEMNKLTNSTVNAVWIYGKGFPSDSDPNHGITWDGSVRGFYIAFVSDGDTIRAHYMDRNGCKYPSTPTDYIEPPTDGWEIDKNPSWVPN